MSGRLTIVDASALDRILAELVNLRADVKKLQSMKEAPATPRLLTGAEVAQVVRCRRQRVYDAIESGELISETRNGRGGPVHFVKETDALQWALTLSRRN